MAVLILTSLAKLYLASLKASILQNSVDAFKHRFCLEPRASVPVLILPSVVKPNLRVLKLCKYFCFKTSLLYGTTATP
ncbi:hypothetical protein FUT79_10175 [Treponema phagedenis]|uniref:Uncharacterized protein n=1 Tax=Treponema phagedenis TaxID=162 RepID=A0AAE6M7L8_TREPH|nr:hypothetical protein FUT79_10175 [Treponema phagedenis]QEJ97995.1 hypothetical protein FUT82_08290 [Treponema phagedenis]QEK03502.1 hypothetical protein FUT83_06585 [Treponema phagedenis]QEK09129.1 hypothetical protein FUT81_06560 [Treponema phagedenis]